ncbi:MAG: hypothetical protein V7K14_30575 [Nostoc sp.]|uniref:hypothetical protein n=1 Tax=Nostoc sp. TaxID=1180 RepID=UPI002FF63737
MESKNGKNRTTEIRQGSYRSQPEGTPRSMGTLSGPSTGYGTYQIPAFGEDRDKSDTLVAGQQSVSEIAGKLVSQLVEETEKQLAYYEQQSELLRNRLKELKQIASNGNQPIAEIHDLRTLLAETLEDIPDEE